MPIVRSIIAALLIGASSTSSAPAQTPERAVAVAISRDSATRLILFNREIVFQFTERGARDITAGIVPKANKDDWNWMDDVLKGSAAGVDNMRMVFKLAAVREARYAQGAVILYMRSRPLNASDKDRRGMFIYENVPEDQAQNFVRALKLLKGTR